ncbi:unnamed protein product [Lactuca virosa]|uniref:Uncharacterized protein n=1 Tax=Lactuca virosa TaxID=75947 RepID=A0AAU9NS44_9ASTR|nr:unnamed protein product [Lactuca virosa]
MTSNASTTPSVGSTAIDTHKRDSDDIGWEYGFISDKSNLDRLKWKLKNKAKLSQDEALRFVVRQEFHDSVDGVESSFGLKAPNVIGPMDGYANKINPEEDLNARKGKNIILNNIVQKERIFTVHKYISRWAYESAIPFHALEKESFKMMLEVVGQFRTRLPPPTRYDLSDTILKHEVERTKSLLKKKEQECKKRMDARL